MSVCCVVPVLAEGAWGGGVPEPLSLCQFLGSMLPSQFHAIYRDLRGEQLRNDPPDATTRLFGVWPRLGAEEGLLQGWA